MVFIKYNRTNYDKTWETSPKSMITLILLDQTFIKMYHCFLFVRVLQTYANSMDTIIVRLE